MKNKNKENYVNVVLREDFDYWHTLLQSKIIVNACLPGHEEHCFKMYIVKVYPFLIAITLIEFCRKTLTELGKKTPGTVCFSSRCCLQLTCRVCVSSIIFFWHYFTHKYTSRHIGKRTSKNLYLNQVIFNSVEWEILKVLSKNLTNVR